MIMLTLPQFLSARCPERAWWWTILILLGLMSPTAVASWLDPFELGGQNIWHKPLKFQAAFAIHFSTLALLQARCSPASRRGVACAWILRLSLLGLLAELPYIMLQAARHEPSHFHDATALGAFMYFGVMATGAALLAAATLAMGVLLWRAHDARMSATLRRGAAAGLILSAALMTLIGGYISQHMSHQAPAGTDSLILGAADLRVHHFLANHTVHGMVAAALVIERLCPAKRQGMALALAATTWTLGCLFNVALAIF